MYLDPLLCEMEHVVDMGQSPGLEDLDDHNYLII